MARDAHAAERRSRHPASTTTTSPLRLQVSTNRLSGTAVIRGVAGATSGRCRFDLVGLRGHEGDASPARAARASTRATASCGSRCRRRSSAGQRLPVTVAYARRSAAAPLAVGHDRLGGTRRRRAGGRRSPRARRRWFPCNDVPSDKATYRIRFDDRSGLHGRRQRRAQRRPGHAAAARRRGSSSRTRPRRRTS